MKKIGYILLSIIVICSSVICIHDLWIKPFYAVYDRYYFDEERAIFEDVTSRYYNDFVNV